MMRTAESIKNTFKEEDFYYDESFCKSEFSQEAQKEP